jgi:hypothetical protein
MIEDTPTSRVRSAAQGYVEIAGRCRPLDGARNLAPLTQRPCVWWHFRIQKRTSSGPPGKRRTSWRTVNSGRSEQPFLLDDGTEGDPIAFFPTNAETLEAPSTAPTLAISATASTLVANTIYRYFYTRVGGGIESGPSPVASVTTTSSRTISLSGLEADTANSGYKKWVYREDAGNGIFRRVAIIDEATTTLVDSGLAKTIRYDEDGQFRQAIRFWPVPAEAGELELRYARTPAPLVADSDVLEFPVAHHHAVCWMAVTIMLARMKDITKQQRDLAETQAGRAIQRMLNREMGETAHAPVMKQWSARSRHPYGRAYEGIIGRVTFP